jgi:predicted alpha/beta superfamily hydrolase
VSWTRYDPRQWLMLLAFCWAAPAFCDETVKVEIRVNVPSRTPPDATLYMAGNLDVVGSWKVDGVALQHNADGTYSAHLNAPRGQVLEYKINRGSWQTVEKGKSGEEIGNHVLSIDGDMTAKITVAQWADQGQSKPEPVKSTATGDIHYHEHFHSEILHNDRQLIVWLPPNYAAEANSRFPVLYLHDGQNCFDASTSFSGVEWRADETADALIRAGKIRPIIIVGIANVGAARMNEYTPTRDAKRKAGGDGEKYAQFLITEVKPFIDRTYRTLPDRGNTAVAGSSLGGLISLYLGLQHGDVFGQIGVMSPSLFWDDRSLLRKVQENPAKIKGERVWIDIGTTEGDGDDQSENVADAVALVSALQGAGMADGKDYRYLEVPGGKHNEAAWAARFDQVLTFFFGK